MALFLRFCLAVRFAGKCISKMSDCAKCKTAKRDGLVGCEASCSKWFHFSSVNLTESEFRLLEKSKNLSYFCDRCRKNCEFERKDEFERLERSIVEMNDHIAALNDNYQSLKSDLVDCMKEQFKEFYGSLSKSLGGKVPGV